MEVRVSDVKKWVGREESVHLEEPWPEMVQARADYPLMDVARIDVSVRNAGGGTLLVHGSGTVCAHAVCSRCAEIFDAVLPFEIDEEFRDEPGPRDENLDYWRFTGDVIDLDDAVADAVGLSFPIALLCRPDCQGLCPVCGANWNQSDCECAPLIDDRWAALSQIVRDPDHDELERNKHGRSET